ncbi:MAG: hypothetical protein R2758_11900 [Bacteroidales bacterium]
MKFNAGVASTTLLDTELAGKTIAGEALSGQASNTPTSHFLSFQMHMITIYS